jgi:hypothetical protein
VAPASPPQKAVARRLAVSAIAENSPPPNSSVSRASDMLPNLKQIRWREVHRRKLSNKMKQINGGRDRDRTCDHYDVNVGLSKICAIDKLKKYFLKQYLMLQFTHLRRRPSALIRTRLCEFPTHFRPNVKLPRPVSGIRHDDGRRLSLPFAPTSPDIGRSLRLKVQL